MFIKEFQLKNGSKYIAGIEDYGISIKSYVLEKRFLGYKKYIQKYNLNL